MKDILLSFCPTILSSITASIFIKSELLAEISAKMLGLKIKTELPEYVDSVTRNIERGCKFFGKYTLVTH